MSPAALSRSSPANAYPAPLWRAGLCQLAGVSAATFAGVALSHAGSAELASSGWIAIEAGVAACVAVLLGMPWWWIALNAVFGPALALGIAMPLSPGWSALAFILLMLVYGGTQRTRVPLYLSSAQAVQCLLELVPPDRPIRLLDIGAGTGTVLATISRERANVDAEGIERAPLPFAIARLRAIAASRRFRVRWGNLWAADLSQYDMVYAYLSPAPMAALWQKACREMKPGSMLVSLSFVVPGVAPSRMIPAGRDWLYVWTLP